MKKLITLFLFNIQNVSIMNVLVKALRITGQPLNIRKISNNIGGIRDIDLLHDDFNRIQELTLTNEQFHLPFVISEIPPPFCPKCNDYVKNTCQFPPIDDICVDYFDLAANPNLSVQCPIFHEVRTSSHDDDITTKRGD